MIGTALLFLGTASDLVVSVAGGRAASIWAGIVWAASAFDGSSIGIALLLRFAFIAVREKLSMGIPKKIQFILVAAI